MAAVGETEAKQIASCEETKGRCLLAQLMNLGPYKDEHNMQKSIQVDFFYDHLKFAADRGFPWEHVCSIIQFAEEFLTTATDGSISAALRLYQAQSPNLMLELGERNYKVYTDFLFSTFFTHFQLYKYVMSQPRKEKIPQLSMTVHPPVPPLPLSTGKERSVWGYERRLQELEHKEFEVTKQRLKQQQQAEEEAAAKKAAAAARMDTIEPPLTKDTLGEMLRSLLADYAEATSKAISTNIQHVRQELEIKLDKTSLPRPAVLGPPPRYRPKSPIVLATPKTSTGSKADKKNKNQNAADKPKSPKSPKSPARSRTSSRGSKH